MKIRLNETVLGIVCGLLSVVALPLNVNAKEKTEAYCSFKSGFYGFVKHSFAYGDRLWNTSNDNVGAQPDKVAVNGECTNDHNMFYMDGRFSRIGWWNQGECCCMKFRSVLETDFNTGDGNARVTSSRHLRLRHYYVKATHPCGWFFLMGQTWALNGHQDLWGGIPTASQVLTYVGTVKNRTPQFRVGFTRDTCDCGVFKFEGSLEKFGFGDVTDRDGNAVDDTASPVGARTPEYQEQIMPLLVGRVSWLKKDFKWMFAAAYARAHIVVPNAVNDKHSSSSSSCSGKRYHADSYAFTNSMYYKFCDFRVWLETTVARGQARLLSGYFNDYGFNFDHSTFNASRIVGGTVGFSYVVCKNRCLCEDELSFNGLYGVACAKGNPGHSFGKFNLKRASDLRANFYYKFWKKWSSCLEYRRLDSKYFNGKKGHINQAVLSLWYKWGKKK